MTGTGWVVTTDKSGVGMPVTTPRESVIEVKDVNGLVCMAVDCQQSFSMGNTSRYRYSRVAYGKQGSLRVAADKKNVHKMCPC